MALMPFAWLKIGKGGGQRMLDVKRRWRSEPFELIKGLSCALAAFCAFVATWIAPEWLGDLAMWAMR